MSENKPQIEHFLCFITKYLCRFLMQLFSESAEMSRISLPAFRPTSGCVPVEDTHLTTAQSPIEPCLFLLSTDLTVFAITLCKRANRFLGFTLHKYFMGDWVKRTDLQSLLLYLKIYIYFFITGIPLEGKRKTCGTRNEALFELSHGANYRETVTFIPVSFTL